MERTNTRNEEQENDSVQTNSNNNTLESILEKNSNFRKVQEAVKNKLSLMEDLFIGQVKSGSQNVSSDPWGFVMKILKERIALLGK